MPWTPEDRERLGAEACTTGPDGAADALLELLERLPDRSSRTVADFGARSASRLAALAGSFGDVLALSDSTARLDRLRAAGPEAGVRYRAVDFSDLADFARSIDVAVACDAQQLLAAGATLDRLIDGLYGTLREGGIVILTLPAAARIGGPIELHLGRKTPSRRQETFHEVELQYRMRRAGFQGLRLQRFVATEDRPATLFCVAARRASN